MQENKQKYKGVEGNFVTKFYQKLINLVFEANYFFLCRIALISRKFKGIALLDPTKLHSEFYITNIPNFTISSRNEISLSRPLTIRGHTANYCKTEYILKNVHSDSFCIVRYR
jgi:hypothetical protein